jgi:peptide/nickel transport system substrate-binding protein
MCLILLILGACGPSAARPTSEGSNSSSSTRPAEPKTLVVAVRYEPVQLASKPLRATGSTADFTVRLFNAELIIKDARDAPQPYLAEALPQLNTPSWEVFSDGRMDTTWKLKPNLKWHDGQPLTAEDFVFAWQVYSHQELGVSSLRPQNLMDEPTARDAQTLVLHWRALYPEAGALDRSLFQPLPRHVIEPALRQGDPEAIINHPFWTLEYVGAGPYRLERWDPGSLIEAVAYDGHVLGRPKIDRVVVRFFTDENTALANVLSANVHMAIDRALRYEHVVTLRQTWDSPAKGAIILTPTQWRYVVFQLRTDLVEVPALRDVRVRRALSHAIDKQAINEGLFGGEGAMADTLLPKTVPYQSEIERVVPRYPFDLSRTEQLMNEVGFTRAGDGIYASPTGARFSTEMRGDSGAQFEKDLAVVADGWQRAGYALSQYVISTAQFRDAEFRSKFRGLYSTTSGSAQDVRLEFMTSSGIPTAENRWTGSNYGAWSSPEFDQTFRTFNATLDRTERNRLAVELLRLINDDVALIPLFHNFEVAAHFPSLTGPEKPVYFSGLSWNIHQWEMK